MSLRLLSFVFCYHSLRYDNCSYNTSNACVVMVPESNLSSSRYQVMYICNCLFSVVVRTKKESGISEENKFSHPISSATNYNVWDYSATHILPHHYLCNFILHNLCATWSVLKFASLIIIGSQTEGGGVLSRTLTWHICKNKLVKKTTYPPPFLLSLVFIYWYFSFLNHFFYYKFLLVKN